MPCNSYPIHAAHAGLCDKINHSRPVLCLALCPALLRLLCRLPFAFSNPYSPFP